MKPSCPLPATDHPSVQLGHGSGGVMMHRLLGETILPALENEFLNQGHDGAVLELGGGVKYAFTTDSYVVKPRFFSGGDIGCLAVYGTVNDLAMCGARPLYLSAGLILEEGLPMEELERVMASMRAAADRAGVSVVTGDTKVVDRGHGDGVFINTAGVGVIEHTQTISPKEVREGDVILLSGDIGRHGIAILAEREGLKFESSIVSDCAPLHGVVQALLDAEIEIHCLRDLTRGGLASSLKEIASDSGCEVTVRETDIPVTDDVRGACELLGLDPIYVANEGTMIAIVPGADAEKALAAMRGVPESAHSVMVGSVGATGSRKVFLESTLGTKRIVDMLAGEQLPRIC
jgi:hydrogenase expression/formation protein HypE